MAIAFQNYLPSVEETGLTPKAKPLDINGREYCGEGFYYRTAVAAAVNYAIDMFYKTTNENGKVVDYNQAVEILRESFADIWSHEKIHHKTHPTWWVDKKS